MRSALGSNATRDSGRNGAVVIGTRVRGAVVIGMRVRGAAAAATAIPGSELRVAVTPGYASTVRTIFSPRKLRISILFLLPVMATLMGK